MLTIAGGIILAILFLILLPYITVLGIWIIAIVGSLLGLYGIYYLIQKFINPEIISVAISTLFIMFVILSLIAIIYDFFKKYSKFYKRYQEYKKNKLQD